MKKRIVCYGDSNTWGYHPKGIGRMPEDVRWTGVMAALLGSGYTVIEEGLNGRTTVWDDPIEGFKNGRDYIIPCVNSHSPFDLIIIMLGTNDLKCRFSLSPRDIAQGASVLVRDVLTNDYFDGIKPPKVLLVSPVLIGENIENAFFGSMFGNTACARSKEFAKYFKEFADMLGVDFIDAGEHAFPSKYDELHIDEEGHASLGKAMAKKVKEIII